MVARRSSPLDAPGHARPGPAAPVFPGPSRLHRSGLRGGLRRIRARRGARAPASVGPQSKGAHT